MAASSGVTVKTCVVCFDSLPSSEFILLSCGHDDACRFCMADYSESARMVNDKLVLKCPVRTCEHQLTFEDFKAVAPPAVFERYDKTLVSALLVETGAVNCPHTGCENSMYIEDDGATRDGCSVNCNVCGRGVCVSCHLAAHEGTCYDMIVQQSSYDPSNWRSTLWKLRNTRACPHCQTVTRRDGGCRHMGCVRCSRDWCWVCGEDFHAYKTDRCSQGYPRPNELDGFLTRNLSPAAGGLLGAFVAVSALVVFVPSDDLATLIAPFPGIDVLTLAPKKVMGLFPVVDESVMRVALRLFFDLVLGALGA